MKRRVTDECGTEGVRLFSHRLSVTPRLWSYFWYSKTRTKTLKIPTATVMLRESTLGSCSSSGDVSKGKRAGRAAVRSRHTISAPSLFAGIQ
jgi:hypothetical protein